MAPSLNARSSAPIRDEYHPAEGSHAAIEPSTWHGEEDEFDRMDYDESILTNTTSLPSTLLRHQFENGRRFHKFRHGRYPLPNDEEEQDRDTLKHVMSLELTDGKLFVAPVENPQKIIDLGTGTGLWAIEVADLFPEAIVLGIDLSPIQSSWIPPNVKFMVDDIEDEWVHGGDFDYIHIRNVCPALKDVPGLLSRCIENLRPGGYIEIQELGGELLCDDNSFLDGFAPLQLMRYCGAGLAKLGMDFQVGNKLGPLLSEAGFVEISCRTIKCPVGTWPKDKTLKLAGHYMRITVDQLFRAMGAKTLRTLDLGEMEIEALLAGASRGLDEKSRHPYMNCRFWTARRALVG